MKLSNFIKLLIPMMAISSAGAAEYIESQVIVKFKSQSVVPMSDHYFATLASKMGASELKIKDHKLGFGILELNKDVKVRDFLDRTNLQSIDSSIEYIQPNYLYHEAAIPNDIRYNIQWGLKNTGQTVVAVNSGSVPTEDDTTNIGNTAINPGTSGYDIAAEKAWDLLTDCSSTVVGIVDSGISLNNEDLTSNLWTSPVDSSHGFNIVDNTTDVEDRVSGHGTHVASITGARGNNSVGGTGVCWKSNLMALKASKNGSYSSSDIVAALSVGQRSGAKIVNMSIGGGPTYSQEFLLYDQMRSNPQTLFIVAAGNENLDLDDNDVTPCSFSKVLTNVLCVGAVDQKFNRASYSNFGTSAVQISAPGTNIFGGTPFIQSVEYDSFAGWTAGSWGVLGAGSVTGIAMPNNYNGTSNSYTNNLKSSAWLKLVSGVTLLSAEYNLIGVLNVEDNVDYVRVAVANSSLNVNPFQSPSSTNQITAFYEVDRLTTSASNVTPFTSFDLVDLCSATLSNCIIGLQFVSDSANTGYGAYFFGYLDKKLASTNSYKVISGTSMATPFVTGVAALLKSYNPNFTPVDMRNAILGGGKTVSALAGKNSTSKVLNAYGALTFINKPEKPTVTVGKASKF